MPEEQIFNETYAILLDSMADVLVKELGLIVRQDPLGIVVLTIRRTIAALLEKNFLDVEKVHQYFLDFLEERPNGKIEIVKVVL